MGIHVFQIGVLTFRVTDKAMGSRTGSRIRDGKTFGDRLRWYENTFFSIVGDPDRRWWMFSFLQFLWSLAIVKSYGDQSSAIELYLIILRIQSRDSKLLWLQGVNWPASRLFRWDGSLSNYRHLVTSFERKMFTTRAKNNSLPVAPKIFKKIYKERLRSKRIT